MPAYTIPPDNRAAGQPGHIGDHNNISNALTALSQTSFSVINSGFAGGADPTGVVDSTAAIQAAINAAANAAVPSGGGTVYFPPGFYKTSAPLTVNSSEVALQGPGYGYAATIVSAATSPQTAMLILGTSAPAPQHCSVRDLALKGNANSGHGIVVRTENGTIQNVICQFMSGDGFHFSWDGIATTFLDSMVMINCYATQCLGNGMLTDRFLTSSEFFACHFAGNGAGVYGINASGQNLKFFGCHSFQYASGGMLLTSTAEGIQIHGGEYETNLGPGIVMNGAFNVRAIGCAFYGNTTRDVYLTTSCKNIEICSSDFLSAVNASIEIAGVNRASIHDNRFDGPSIGVGTALHAVLCDSGFSNTYLTIHDNVINTTGSFNVAIQMGDATHSQVSGNRVESVSAIQETSGANTNTYMGNDVSAFGASGVQMVGANSWAFNNPGNNPVGHIVTPPTYTAGSASTNSTGNMVRVFVLGSTAVAINGTATGLTAGTFDLAPGDTITPTGAGSWTWFGL